QLTKVPMSPPNWSWIFKVQVPLGFWASSAESGLSGRNEPVNGGNPTPICWAAASSKVVLVKAVPLGFSPSPLLAASTTCDPFGPIRVMIRSLLKVCLIVRLTLTLATTCPAGTPLTEMVDSVGGLFGPPVSPLAASGGIGKLIW